MAVPVLGYASSTVGPLRSAVHNDEQKASQVRLRGHMPFCSPGRAADVASVSFPHAVPFRLAFLGRRFHLTACACAAMSCSSTSVRPGTRLRRPRTLSWKRCMVSALAVSCVCVSLRVTGGGSRQSGCCRVGCAHSDGKGLGTDGRVGTPSN